MKYSLMFRPRLLDALKGYSRATFLSDLAAGVTVGLLGMAPTLTDRLIGGLGGFAALWAIGAGYKLLRHREGLGGGDPKLLGAIGLWLGWQLLPAVLFLAALTGLGVEAWRERIPLVPEGAELCGLLGLDPLGTIASGALLVGVDAASADGLLAAIEAEGIACAEIGRFTAPELGVRLDGDPMPRYSPDEITRAFA